MVHDAVCRNLEIIGEAARRFDDAFRLSHAEVPWRAMTDVRNILIHAYDRVAAEILVDIMRQTSLLQRTSTTASIHISGPGKRPYRKVANSAGRG